MLLSVNGNSSDEAASTTPAEAPRASRPPGEEDTLIEDEVGAELQDTAKGSDRPEALPSSNSGAETAACADEAVPEEMMAVDPAEAALGDKQGIEGAEAKPVDTSKASDHKEASTQGAVDQMQNPGSVGVAIVTRQGEQPVPQTEKGPAEIKPMDTAEGGDDKEANTQGPADQMQNPGSVGAASGTSQGVHPVPQTEQGTAEIKPMDTAEGGDRKEAALKGQQTKCRIRAVWGWPAGQVKGCSLRLRQRRVLLRSSQWTHLREVTAKRLTPKGQQTRCRILAVWGRSVGCKIMSQTRARPIQSTNLWQVSRLDPAQMLMLQEDCLMWRVRRAVSQAPQGRSQQSRRLKMLPSSTGTPSFVVQ